MRAETPASDSPQPAAPLPGFRTISSYRIELARNPPSHFKSQMPLSSGEIEKRRLLVEAYDAARHRQQRSRYSSLLNETRQVQTAVNGVKKDTEAALAMLQGKDVPREDHQTDTERLRQIKATMARLSEEKKTLQEREMEKKARAGKETQDRILAPRLSLLHKFHT